MEIQERAETLGRSGTTSGVQRAKGLFFLAAGLSFLPLSCRPGRCSWPGSATMFDVELFAMGCGISFIALCGAYAYLRERFLSGTHEAKRRIEVRQDRDPAPARKLAAR